MSKYLLLFGILASLNVYSQNGSTRWESGGLEIKYNYDFVVVENTSEDFEVESLEIAISVEKVMSKDESQIFKTNIPAGLKEMATDMSLKIVDQAIKHKSLNAYYIVTESIDKDTGNKHNVILFVISQNKYFLEIVIDCYQLDLVKAFEIIENMSIFS